MSSMSKSLPEGGFSAESISLTDPFTTLVEFPRSIRSRCQRAGLKPQACEIALLLLRHAEKEIALRLGMPTNTVYALAKQVFEGFHVNHRRELVGALVRRR
jgi:DNA-binding CsgD family transcriptional regulator